MDACIGISKYETPTGQSTMNSLDEMLEPGYDPLDNQNGRIEHAPLVPKMSDLLGP